MLDYDDVKPKGLWAVRKKMSQRFISASQIYEKSILFVKLCTASGVVNFKQLEELIPMDGFQSCLPEQLVVQCIWKKNNVLSGAATLVVSLFQHMRWFSDFHGIVFNRDLRVCISVKPPLVDCKPACPPLMLTLLWWARPLNFCMSCNKM